MSDNDFDVQTPSELQGSEIVDKVFHPIDAADFVIADISGRSPNVFYEIAYFHTLGTPIVYIDGPEESGALADLPFYFRNTDVLQLAEKEFSFDRLEKHLMSVFRSFFSGSSPADLTQNPISRFYDVPLMDISAAAGLAAGYFDNFLKPMLANRVGALAVRGNGLKTLVVVRPASIRSSDEDEWAIDEAVPGQVKLEAEAPASRRGAIVLPKVKNGYAFDLPTPLYTLSYSPRYRSLNRRLDRFQRYDDFQKERILVKMESKMIQSFFSTIDYLIRQDRDVSTKRMVVCRTGDLKSFAEANGLSG